MLTLLKALFIMILLRVGFVPGLLLSILAIITLIVLIAVLLKGIKFCYQKIADWLKGI